MPLHRSTSRVVAHARALRLSHLMVLGTGLLFAGCADTPTAPAAEVSPSAATDLVVLFRAVPPGPEGSASPAISMSAAIHTAAAGTAVDVEELPALHGALVHGADLATRARLAADPRVALVEPLRVAKLDQATSNWALDRVDQAQLPLDSRYLNPYSTPTRAAGTGTWIYVFDTGLRLDHTQFTGRVTPGPDFLENPSGTVPVTKDCHGHGTLAASAAAGQTLGTAPGATVIPVRVMTCQGQGTSVDIARALDYIVTQKRAARTQPMVVNMSLAFVGGSAVVDEAVRRVVAEQVPVVVSAGNSSVDACQQSPAREPLAITVGASMNTDLRSAFSNYGSCVDVYAPGSNVLGAHIGSPTMSALWNGTSASAPYVAGLVAAFLGANPTASAPEVATRLQAGASASVIEEGSVTNQKRALVQARFSGPLPPATWGGGTTPAPIDTMKTGPQVRVTGSCIRRVCVLDASTTTSAQRITGYTWTFGGSTAPITAAAASAARVSNVTYLQNGTYTARVTVRDAAGVARVGQVTLTATDTAPTARIATPTCSPTLVCSFDASGSTDDGTISSYQWRFSTNATATGAKTSVTLRAPATLRATLIVTDNAGQRDSTTAEVAAAFGPPTAKISAQCTPLRCVFTTTGTTAPAGMTALRLETGDGRTLTPALTATSHPVVYASAGTYTVRLRVTDKDNRVAEAQQTVTVENFAAPVARMSVRCSPLSCVVDTKASTAPAGLARLEIQTGDERTLTPALAATTHTLAYAKAGTYTIRVRMTDTQQRTAEAEQQVLVENFAAPVARMAVRCSPLSCVVDTKASTAPAGLARIELQTGDGRTLTPALTATTHTIAYTTPGSYTIRLRVTDRQQRTAETELASVVENFAAPRVGLTAQCVPMTCTLTTSSSAVPAGISRIEIETGDGRTLVPAITATTHSVSYATAGTYTVRVRITDRQNRTAESTQQVTVANFAAPTVAFSTTCARLSCSVTTSASRVPAGITRIELETGDGRTLQLGATATKHTVTYPKAGPVTMIVRITDRQDRTAQSQQVVVVR